MKNERGYEGGYWEGKDIPIDGVIQKTYFIGEVKHFCSACGYEVDIICETKVHKQSRSTRCGSELTWHRDKPVNFQKQFVETSELPMAFLMKKPSWIERLLQKLR